MSNNRKPKADYGNAGKHDGNEWQAAIKEIRANFRISQERLAEILSVTFATLNRYERGHHEPTTAKRAEIARLLTESRAYRAAEVEQGGTLWKKKKGAALIAELCQSAEMRETIADGLAMTKTKKAEAAKAYAEAIEAYEKAKAILSGEIKRAKSKRRKG